jgi:hypothetical protein
VTRCSFCSGNLTDVLVHRRGAVDLEEPLINHPRCWYFDGAQGKLGCQLKADTPRPYRSNLQAGRILQLHFSLRADPSLGIFSLGHSLGPSQPHLNCVAVYGGEPHVSGRT